MRNVKNIARFRYSLIAPLVIEAHLVPGNLTQRAREIAARKYDIPYSKRTSVSVETLLEWVHRLHCEIRLNARQRPLGGCSIEFGVTRRCQTARQ